MRCAAFNIGPDFHLLDHIAPLAELLQMPLIVTEERNWQLAARFYPQVSLRYLPDLEFQLKSIAEEFDTLFECKYWQPHLKNLLQTLYQKTVQLIFCPHGQSDKGFQTPLLAPYATQDGVLLYGALQIQMLQQLNIWPALSRYAILGNHRYRFYQKHQSFYDTLAEEEIFSRIQPKKRTLLYAPTWRDADSATSFFTHGPKILSELPEDWNLLIKLHPLLEQRDPADFYRIAALAEKKPNALLIDEWPPVYPILARSDVYLGDASSVGYDFLAFERPMYFLPTAHPGNLHRCGTTINPHQNLYTQLTAPNLKQKEQKALYSLAFAKETEDLREKFGNKNSNYSGPVYGAT